MSDNHKQDVPGIWYWNAKVEMTGTGEDGSVYVYLGLGGGNTIKPAAEGPMQSGGWFQAKRTNAENILKIALTAITTKNGLHAQISSNNEYAEILRLHIKKE